MSVRVVKVNGLRTPEQRGAVCYIGRAFVGWTGSPWGNPFKANLKPAKGDTLFKCDTCQWWGLLGIMRKQQGDFGCFGAPPLGCRGTLRTYPQSEMVGDLLAKFRQHAESQPTEYLADLWEACEHGAKPLGCWCIDATHGDSQPVVCHAQILAEMLHNRFGEQP